MAKPIGGTNPDAALRAFVAACDKAAVDTDLAVAQALSSVTGSVTITEGESGPAVSPPNLMNLTFAHPKVGLDQAGMDEFLANLAVQFDSATSARILNQVARVPTQKIGTLSRLVRFWIANPEE